jgi:hypothetical protein
VYSSGPSMVSCTRSSPTCSRCRPFRASEPLRALISGEGADHRQLEGREFSQIRGWHARPLSIRTASWAGGIAPLQFLAVPEIGRSTTGPIMALRNYLYFCSGSAEQSADLPSTRCCAPTVCPAPKLLDSVVAIHLLGKFGESRSACLSKSGLGSQ